MLGVALAASVTSLRNGFVYDDVHVVVENGALHSLDSLPRLLTASYWPEGMRDRLYRPAAVASLAVDWAVGGGRPFAFHVTNVLLHLCVVALVLALSQVILGRGAVIAALWFAVHPVHVEVFANVVGRAELLAAVGYLGAVLAYGAEGRSARRPGGGAERALWTVLTLLSAAIAFASKEHALSLPAALLLADAWWAHRDGVKVASVVRRHAWLWAGVVVVAVGYLCARSGALGTTFGGGVRAAGLAGLSALQRPAAMLPVVLEWVRLLVFPLRLSADYAPNHLVLEPRLTVSHAAAVLLLVGAVAGAWRLRRRAPGVAFGAAWFAIAAAITSNVLVPTGVLFGERLLYLPSVGAAVVVGALWEMVPPRGGVWAATVLVLGLLGARTLERIPVWGTQDRFFAARGRDAPDSYLSHWQKGAQAFDRGDARTGEAELQEAVRIYPYDAALLEELGRRYFAAGFYGPADRWSTAAFGLDSTRSAAAAQAIASRVQGGRADSAAALAKAALSRSPESEVIALAGIAALNEHGEPRQALAVARRFTYRHPRDAAYQLLAADAAARAGLCEEARSRFERAAALARGEAERAAISRRSAAAAACGSGR